MPIPSARSRAAFRIDLAVAAIATLAVAVPAAIVELVPTVPAHRRAAVKLPQRVVPPAELPPVEPVVYQDLPPDEARAFNATVPFSTDPNPSAKPFTYRGTDAQYARAAECLATAVLYEAGDDTVGQRAVAQVVINRLRHPAFPKTICGVIFQGEERRTGCQFSFTCDRALIRHQWPEAAWERAREVASLALHGAVYKPVGYATHYHTDWVVPYWSASLDKIVAVHTHLFFRWTGWWGTPPAFRRAVSWDEPAIAQLDAIRTPALDAALAEVAAGEVEAATATGEPPLPLTTDPNSFLVTLAPGAAADTLPAFAGRICADRTFCKVMAWRDAAATPGTIPLAPEQVAAMAFSYLRDRAHAFEKTLWNCTVFPRIDATQCMKTQVLGTPPAAATPPPVATTSGATAPAPDLSGVRRKSFALTPTPKPPGPQK